METRTVKNEPGFRMFCAVYSSSHLALRPGRLSPRVWSPATWTPRTSALLACNSSHASSSLSSCHYAFCVNEFVDDHLEPLTNSRAIVFYVVSANSDVGPFIEG